MLIDGPKVLAARSPHGIVGDCFFHDAQHPNLRGYAALAEDVLNQLGTRRAFGWPAATPVPVVDIEACLPPLPDRRGTLGEDLLARRRVFPGDRLHSLRSQVSQRAVGGLRAVGGRDPCRRRIRPRPISLAGLCHRSPPRRM